MLTKNDLQQIREAVKEEVRVIVKEEVQKEVGSQLEFQLQPVKSDLQVLKDDIKVVKKDIKNLKKRVLSIKKTLDAAIDHFDRENTDTIKRVTGIENHLGIAVS